MLRTLKFSPLFAALLLGACTTVPTGPTVAVFPGTGKSFEQFNQDDAVCKDFASNQVSGAVQAANDKAVESGVVGTAIGAAVGAAFGGRQGAAVGAGTGLVVGSAEGANASQYGTYNVQRRYDIAYEQCMYTKGNSVPVQGQAHRRPPPAYAPPPGYAPPGYAPPSGYAAPPAYTPPPPNTPPPPQ